MNFRPLLAAKRQKDQSLDEFYEVISRHLAQGPMGVTPKIDGIRAGCYPATYARSQALCRSLKEVPNRYVFNQLAKCPIGLDGELTCGKTFQAVTSGIMTHTGEPDFTFYVFDWADYEMVKGEAGTDYYTRTMRMHNNRDQFPKFVELLMPRWCKTLDEVLALDEEFVKNGAEGTMLRRWDSPYKFGRSTQREGYLIALKRFEDAEAMVIGTYEEQENNNPMSLNALGYTERSSHKANMRGKGRLGGFVCRDLKTGVEFRCGSGLDASQREEFWMIREQIVAEGRIIKYKHQPHGRLEKPRTPIWLGFRDRRDMDPESEAQQRLL